MDKQVTDQQIDPLLIPFIEAKDDAEARQQLERLITRIRPLVEKITRASRRPEDASQDSVRLVIKSLWDCKADPVGRSIENFEGYVAVIAKHTVTDEIRRPPEKGDEKDVGSLSDVLPSSDLPPDKQVEQKEFLEKLWADIEQLSLPQRRAYLLNFTDGQLDWFVFYGVVSIRRIGATLKLSDEHFARLWPMLKLSDEERRLAESPENYDLKFARLWQYLPLNDLTIAKILGTEPERQQVINLRAVARRNLRRTLLSLRPSS